MALLAIGLGLVVVALILALTRERRRLRPLEDLVEAMEKVDLSSPRLHLPPSIDGVGETEEVERIELAFLRMMRRLEAERRRAGSAALHAQEEERARVARDLHDEVNQSLTGLLLRLEAAREAAPPQLEAEIDETKALANQAMNELLSLARQLRPTALDDLGLAAAIGGQVERLGRGDMETSLTTQGGFSDLGDDAQLVVYRVAQEALNNAARHSGAAGVEVGLWRAEDGGVALVVADDGRGFAFDESERGLGIVRSGLRLLLERQPDIEVIGEAGDGAEARDLAVRERPDLAILDVKMPKLTGLQATREIKKQAPEVSVLILSMHDDERYLFEALKAGASGYVLKAQADTDLLAAIRAVERGEPFLTPEAQRTLIKDVLERGSSGEEELTPREEEIVKLVAEAHTTKQIAEVLHLSEKTVENHRANAMRKLGMRDRVELVRYAIRRGLIEP